MTKVITTLEQMLFTVEKVQQDKKTVTAQEYEILGYLDGIDEEPTTLNTCSNRFNLFKNEQVFPVIENILDEANCTYSKNYKMNDEFTTFHAVYIITHIDGVDCGIDVGNNDKIYFTIIVDNSYNGLLEATAIAGLFRMICGNGLVIPLEGHEKSNFAIKGKHTAKLDQTFDGLKAMIFRFVDSKTTIKKRINVLTDKMVVNYGDRVEEVLNATKLKPSKVQIEFITDTIKNEANEFYNGKVNDWLIYNGINAYIFKGTDSNGNKSKALPTVKRKSDEKVLNYLIAN